MRQNNTIFRHLVAPFIGSTNIERRCLSFCLITVIISWTFLLNYIPVSNGQISSTCTKLALYGIHTKASGYSSPNLPSYVRDNDLTTRWSNTGIPSWIGYDIGITRTICYVDIAWFRGDLRVHSFTISISTDGVNYKPVYSGKSSGTTEGFERYNFPDSYARHVRITVTGNSESNVASIKEFSLYTNCLQLEPSAVSANGNDGNVPQNTNDDNLATRWSNSGIPSWIEYELASSRTICYVDIAWYRGDIRVNDFEVWVSNDRVNYAKVLSAQSSGSTAGFESYNVKDSSARYVMIKVTGNSENNFASISEVSINRATGITIQPPSSSGGGTDKFGIKKIYPTKSNGEEWFMNMANPTGDSRSFLYTEPANSVSKNADGTWKIKAPFVRYHAYTSSGYHPELITTYNQKSLASKGYMQSANDWKNVEMTGYIKVNSFQQDDDTAWYNRGGRHTSEQPCEGTGYKGDVYYSGKTRFPKEQWHNGGYSFSPTVPATTSIEDRWVGIKYVVYNFVQNGKTVVKLENWLDNSNNGNWAKIYEYTDTGGWGSQGTQCGGAPDQIITWGGPVATFRWDSATDVDIKNFSVREIQPPQ